jgi:GIY-YIG catalytic domain
LQSTPFILTFNNSLVSGTVLNVYKLLAESWKELLTTSPELNDLATPKIVFRKGKTINNLLISSMFPPPRWLIRENLNSLIDIIPSSLNPVTDIVLSSLQTFGNCGPCNEVRCKTCRNIYVSSNFTSSYNNKNFRLYANLNCKSSHVVYLIICLKCKIQYVGETSKPLHVRMNNHRSCISQNRDTPIGIHFNSIGHNLTHVKVIPIEVQYNTRDRRSREYFWQLHLSTIFPKGLNKFPVDKRALFKRLNICSFDDVEVFWTLKCLESNTDDSDDSLD